MHTRSSSKFVGEPSTNLISMNPKLRNRRRSKTRVEPFSLEVTPVVTMANQRTMVELLRAPTEGYADAIVVPPIPAEHFELKHSLMNLITSTLKYKDVPETSIKLMLFLFSIDDPARIWLDKEPSRSILTWDDLVSKFINHFFPLSKTTNLRNEISNFQQKFEETFSEAWDHFKDLFSACPHHKFTELHQLDTFYNGLNPSDQDSLNSGAGGNLLERSAHDVLKIIKNKSKVRNLRNKPIVSQVKASNDDPSEIANAIASAVTSAMTAMFKQHQCPATDGNTFSGYQGNIQEYVSAAAVNYNQGNTRFRPQMKLHEKDDNLALKFVEIFRKLHFDLSFADALLHMPKFALMFKSLLNKKEKLFDLATTPVNKNCSSVILKILPKKLGDADKFLIPCDFPELVECLALADLGASINLMPLSIWKKLSLPELTPTRMILELADRSTTRPAKLTLRVDDEAITIKVGQTSKYSYNDAESINRIDIIDVACEEYVQEVLGFSDKSKSGNPTLILDLIIALSSLSLTPFEGGDFILDEIKACLTSKSFSLGIDDTDFDLEGDIHLLEKFLNDDPSSSPLPPKELNVEEIKIVKSSIDEPPKLELKDLPSHLEYAFLEGTDKLPVIISKELKDEEKSALLKVLKSHKRAIVWKISNIKGIDPRFCTHKILMEDDLKPTVQHQRRVNPKVHEVIKKEVIKLLDDGLIYPISDSPWVSPVYCVPKKGDMTVI
nr:reverse transcriptase domain-containing protein [Tanacetum cinerariifolium]